MWRAIVNGLRVRAMGASALAERSTPASNMARRIGMGGRLEQRLCSLPVRLALSEQLTQRSWLPRQNLY